MLFLAYQSSNKRFHTNNELHGLLDQDCLISSNVAMRAYILLPEQLLSPWKELFSGSLFSVQIAEAVQVTTQLKTIYLE